VPVIAGGCLFGPSRGDVGNGARRFSFSKETQMANIMISQDNGGSLLFYLPKKDLEERIVSLEFTGPEKWGGELHLANGQSYFIDPLERTPKLPMSFRARRLGGAED